MATKSQFIEPLRAGRGVGASGKPSYKINWKNPSDNELVSFIDSQVRDHDERHYWWVRRAKLQLAWAAGDQLAEWDNKLGGLADTYDPQGDRIALFVNRIKPAILNWISLVTQRPLTFRVHPSTSDDVDIASAKVQDKLARYYWRKLLGDDLFMDSLWMMFCTGCAFFKNTWDSDAGQEFDIIAEDVLDEDELEDADGDKNLIRDTFRKMIGRLSGEKEEEVSLDEGDKLTLNQGDLACEFIDGFSVVPPYRAPSIKSAPWMIIRQYRHMEDLIARYGSIAETLTPMLHEPTSSFEDTEGPETWDSGSGTGGSTPQRSVDHVMTYELWRPRNLRRKDHGNMVVIAQHKVLTKGKHPYEHGEIPLVMIQELPSPKKFWPPSTVQDLMNLQREINISRTQVAIHKAATVEPRIIVEKGCGLDEMAFTEPNEIVEVNPGKINAIRPWIPEPLPQYMPYFEQSLRKDFEDVSRNHAPSYGKTAGSVKSGKHAVALQEADMRMNTPMFRLLRESLGQVARQWLSLLKQFGGEERAITIIGENNQPEVVRWSSQTFPHAEFNVECDLGTPMDRQTTIELIDMLTARGWFQPGQSEHRETVMRWLGQGVTQEVNESHQDRMNSELENQQMLQGVLVDLSDGDDDTVHLYGHEREQKTAAYRRAVMSNPDVEKIFNIHKIHHEHKRLEKKIRQQVAAKEIQMDLAKKAGLMPQAQSGGQGSGVGGRSQPPAPGQRPQGPQPPPGQTVRQPGQGGMQQQQQPMGGRRATSRPPFPGFKR